MWYDLLFLGTGWPELRTAAADALHGVTVECDDILMNITGASILRTCVVDPDVLPARVNQHVCTSLGQNARYQLDTFTSICLTAVYQRLSDGDGRGASRQAVTQGYIESVPLVIPLKAVLDVFAKLVGPLFGATSNNNSQSRSLASIRDARRPSSSPANCVCRMPSVLLEGLSVRWLIPSLHLFHARRARCDRWRTRAHCGAGEGYRARGG